MSEVVTFNNLSLALVPGLSILGTNPHRPAPVKLTSSQLVTSNKSVVSSQFYGTRKINILCSVEAGTKTLLQQRLQTLESILQGREKVLNITWAGVATDFTATKSNLSVTYDGGGFAEVDIEFTCSDPMGYATSSTTLYNYAHLVGGAYSFAVTWLGNVTQRPVITITINSVTGGSNQTISISNTATGQTLTVTSSYAANDVLIIDTKNKTVTINGVTSLATGNYPEWTATQPIVYADGFTTRNIAFTAAYQVRNV